MQQRVLGRTGLNVSEIGFGCGPTAGLMINGAAAVRRRAVAHALDQGITYFDTAPIYGDTVSEAHLGETLRDLAAQPVVATKLALEMDDLDDIPAAVVRSIEHSLQRLNRETIDVLQLHNRVAAERAPRADIGVGAMLTVDDVLGDRGVAETLETLRAQGKVRSLGCCAFGGEVAAVEQLIDSGRFDTILVHFSLLNPSAFWDVPDAKVRSYGQVGTRAAARGMGIVILRVLEGGALTGTEQAHALAGGIDRSKAEYQAKLRQTERLGFLLEDGRQTLAQAAIRFALARSEVSAVLVGFSDVEHMDEAAAASELGPLPPEDVARVEQLYHSGGLW